jgi:6-phosphofructokinase 1
MTRIGVVTSGGDAPGMNAALRAVVRTALARKVSVVGFFHGYEGLINDESRNLDSQSVGGIIDRGGTILRTARCARFMERAGREMAYGVLKSRRCEGLVVIGGDGSLRGALTLQNEFDFPVMGVPATIDNDIFGTDFSIGFDTAVNTALEGIDRVRETAYSHDRVFVIEVMGRDNGSLALEAGLGGGAEAILVPEVPFDLAKICTKMAAMAKKGKRSSIIVVAEGAMKAEKVMEYLVEYFKDSPNFECRAVVMGHMQRGGSPTAFDRVLAMRLAGLATNRLLSGFQGEMAGIVGNELLGQPMTYVLSSKRQFDREKLFLAEVMAN